MARQIIRPKKLKKGSTVALIAPASAPRDLSRINKAVLYFESLGYEVIVGKHVSGTAGYLSAPDQERAADLHEVFLNKEVEAIICLRGGYGTPRLLELIDYKLIAKNPKIFVGYSDITAMQMAIFKKTGLITFAGPMAAVDLYEAPNSYAEAMFWDVLTGSDEQQINIPGNYELHFKGKKKVKGTLLGGNLALLSALCGSKFLPSFSDAIVLLEDVGEKPYRIDRMLNQLILASNFAKAAAVILGQFSDCNEDEGTPTLSLKEVLNHYIYSRYIPVVENFPHGHIAEIATIALGIDYVINFAEEKIIRSSKAVL